MAHFCRDATSAMLHISDFRIWYAHTTTEILIFLTTRNTSVHNYFCLSRPNWYLSFAEPHSIKLRRNIRVSEQTFRGIGDLYNLFERDIDLNFTLEYHHRSSIQRWNKRSSRQNSWRKTIFIIIDAKHNPQCTSSTRGPYSTNCCVPWKRHLLSTHVMNMLQWKSQCQGQKEYIIFQKKILQKPERRWSLGTTTIYML